MAKNPEWTQITWKVVSDMSSYLMSVQSKDDPMSSDGWSEQGAWHWSSLAIARQPWRHVWAAVMFLTNIVLAFLWQVLINALTNLHTWVLEASHHGSVTMKRGQEMLPLHCNCNALRVKCLIEKESKGTALWRPQNWQHNRNYYHRAIDGCFKVVAPPRDSIFRVNAKDENHAKKAYLVCESHPTLMLMGVSTWARSNF